LYLLSIRLEPTVIECPAIEYSQCETRAVYSP
jgi:hypothetical protein